MRLLKHAAYSVICASAIGYLFGVVFAVRAITMSGIQGSLPDTIALNGWVGLTFAIVFAPVGLVALGVVESLRRIVPSRRTRVWGLCWIVLGIALGIPFLGYYVSNGIEVARYPGADSPWDLLPFWLVRVGRWMGFSALTAALLAFAATFGLERWLWSPRAKNRALRLLAGGPAMVLATWLLPPLFLKLGAPATMAEPSSASSRVFGAHEPVAPVVLVGWDGVSWDVLDPLLAEGRLPNLSRLVGGGVRADLTTYEPTSSPLIWTTISTGHPPGLHGVRSHVENRFVGMTSWFYFPPSMGFDRIFGSFWERSGVAQRVRVTSHSRTRKAFWNVLDESGRSVGLVNWRVAWPAEHFRGFNVTRRFHAFVEQVMDGNNEFPEDMTDAELIAELPGVLEPAVTAAVIGSCMVESGRRAREWAEAVGLPLDLAPVDEVAAHELGMHLYRRSEKPVVLFATYIYETDGVMHTHWRYREPQFFFGVSEKDAKERSHVIDAMIMFADAVLGDVLETVAEGSIVILLSDHGHGPVFGDFGRSGGHPHAPPGILVMSGPGVAAGSALDAPSVFDIMPTIAYLTGLPIEEEMSGRVLLEAFEADVTRGRPIVTIPSYGARSRPASETPRVTPLDMEDIQALKRLGYVN